MKILFSVGTLTSGGAERVVSILANKLSEMGHKVEILLYYDKPVWYKINNDVKIVNDEEIIGKANPFRHLLFRHDYFKDSDADLIISFLAPFNIINLLAIIGTSKKIIVADRNDPRYTPVNPIFRIARNFLYRFSDGIVFQSVNNMSYFSQKVQKKSRIIMNPVSMGDQCGEALKVKKRDEIVSVARVIRQKNPEMLIRAFAMLVEIHPEYKLTMYGDGEITEEMRKLTHSLGINESVSIHEAVHDVFERIKSAKLFVLTSNYEGLPNALIEAMCLGIPVISTKVSGAVDLIKDGENGRLVDCRDTTQLFQVLTDIVENYSKAEAYAKNALEVKNKLNVEKIVDEWLRYIDEIIKKDEYARNV